VLARLRTLGLQRGVLGGSRPWLVVAGVTWALRALQWAWRTDEVVLYEGTLEPGERLEIVARRASGAGRRDRRGRRAARR
jgi:hypothetical protein